MRVKGFVSATIGVGTNEYANILTTPIMRLGKRSSGSRITSAMSVERLMVPKRVVVAWFNAAATISREEGAGTVLRWKYHCETVAAVVARWIPLIIEMVQMNISTK